MIAPYLYDSIFLDLFAGSGGIGIEALSRGSNGAVFVREKSKSYGMRQREPSEDTF